MTLHQKYNLTKIISAAGSFTPLGVSRSSARVGQAAAEALSEFFVMDELQDVASAAIADWTGAEAAAVTHCVAAGLTLGVAAAMTGGHPDGVAVLPDTSGMPSRVVLPAGSAVNYGHPLLQDLRLAGATPVLAGTDERSSVEDIETELAKPGTACLLLVSSRLVRGEPIDLAQAVSAAHRHGVPVIIDGAAQDMRIPDLLATGADLVLISAHKYLASPTAGLIIGRRELVTAARAHEKGIGRAMKATKEAIIGVLASIEERKAVDMEDWQRRQQEKVTAVVEEANALPGVNATAVTDPVGMPFSRVQLDIDQEAAGMNAAALAASLKSGTPSVRVMEHSLAEGKIILELVALTGEEAGIIVAEIAQRLR